MRPRRIPQPYARWYRWPTSLRRVAPLVAHLITSTLATIGVSFGQQYLVGTLAGGGPPPTPVAAVSASISPPSGIAVDPAGNIFFTSAECVFELSPSGVLTRIAGNARKGYTGDGGLATSAQLGDGGVNSGPAGGLAFDSAGNLYIADSENFRLRKISPSGVITTIAGNGKITAGGDGGPAANAALGIPGSVVADSAGNVYTADPESGIIRKISTNGLISTFASLGQSTAVSLSTGVGGLALDSDGNLVVSDAGHNSIRKISPDGVITTIAGTGEAGFSGDGGPARFAMLASPRGLAVDSANNIYFADFSNRRIRKVASDGIITTVAGGGGTYPGDSVEATQAELYFPTAVGIDAKGNIYIAAGWIQKISTDGTISIVAGNGTINYGGDGGPAISAQLFEPLDVALDGTGKAYIVDQANQVIRLVDNAGIITTVAGNGACSFSGDGGPATKASFCYPARAAVDSDGNLYIADSHNNRVRKVNTEGVISTIAGNGASDFSGDGGPALQASLNYPEAVAVDAGGDLYIADYDNYRIRKVTPDGIITTIAGVGVQGFTGDGGPAAQAEISLPEALAVDSAGDLLFADAVNNRIRMITPAGTISTVAGGSSGSYPGDGNPATEVPLFGPTGVALDSAGDIFISSVAGGVFKVSKSGTISTITGSTTGVSYSGNGVPASTAVLGGALFGIRVDSAGRIYVADGSTSVRILSPVNQSVIIGSIVDAASQAAIPVSPGKIVVIYGAGLGPTQLVSNAAQNGVFASQLAGTSVSFNGLQAPILYTSASQVAAIVPYEVAGTVAQVTVAYQGSMSSSVTVPIAPSEPSLFSANGTGAGQVAAVNGDGSINDAAHPVKAGGYISLYATGEGGLTPAGSDGRLAPIVAPFPQPQASVSVTVAGQPASVIYAGSAPGEVEGLMQVVLQVPQGVQAGGYVPVVLQVGAASTVAGAAWIAVSN